MAKSWTGNDEDGLDSSKTSEEPDKKVGKFQRDNPCSSWEFLNTGSDLGMSEGIPGKVWVIYFIYTALIHT